MGADADPLSAARRVGKQTEGWSDERIAINDARFRDANESIEAAAEEFDISEGIPFLCECADPSCTTALRLSLTEYEEIRAESTYFLNAPGHVVAAHGAARVVTEARGYTIVEKIGRAGEVAELTDPRETKKTYRN